NFLRVYPRSNAIGPYRSAIARTPTSDRDRVSTQQARHHGQGFPVWLLVDLVSDWQAGFPRVSIVPMYTEQRLHFFDNSGSPVVSRRLSPCVAYQWLQASRGQQRE